MSCYASVDALSVSLEHYVVPKKSAFQEKL